MKIYNSCDFYFHFLLLSLFRFIFYCPKLLLLLFVGRNNNGDTARLVANWSGSPPSPLVMAQPSVCGHRANPSPNPDHQIRGDHHHQQCGSQRMYKVMRWKAPGGAAICIRLNNFWCVQTFKGGPPVGIWREIEGKFGIKTEKNRKKIESKIYTFKFYFNPQNIYY